MSSATTATTAATRHELQCAAIAGTGIHVKQMQKHLKCMEKHETCNIDLLCATDKLKFGTRKTLTIKMAVFRWPDSMRMPRRMHQNDKKCENTRYKVHAY